MSNQVKYAIRCSTKEEAMELMKEGRHKVGYGGRRVFIRDIFNDYCVITYAEAREKGLLGEKIGDTIGNLNLGYNAGDTRISDFQILDMLKVIIQELEHYHSYKSMAQDLKNIQTVLKNDWGNKVVASKIPEPKVDSNDLLDCKENLVEKIMEDIEKLEYINIDNIGRKDLKEILEKHLSK